MVVCSFLTALPCMFLDDIIGFLTSNLFFLRGVQVFPLSVPTSDDCYDLLLLQWTSQR